MKQLCYSLLVLLVSTSVNAQLTLEHTFSMTGEKNSNPHEIFGDILDSNWGDPVKGFYILNKNNYEVTIYNTDYSIKNTFKAPALDGMDLTGVQIATTSAFNTDENVEFLLNFNIYENYRRMYAVVVCNESGQILHRFDNAISAWFITTADGALKLKVNKGTYNDISETEYYYTNSCEIYTLPGQVSTQNNVQLKNTSAGIAYPNPARQKVNLPYHLEKGEQSMMRIYNMNGQLMDQKKIDAYFDKIVLDVNHYSPGQYIYEYNGQSNRFVVR